MWTVKLENVVRLVNRPVDKVLVKVIFENGEGETIPKQYEVNIKDVETLKDISILSYEDLQSLNKIEALQNEIKNSLNQALPDVTREEVDAKLNVVKQ